jgi:hypothetical protein
MTVTKCDDCGFDYTGPEDDHWLFCEARACSTCLRQFSQIVPLDRMGERTCDTCLNEDGTGIGTGAYHTGESEDD